MLNRTITRTITEANVTCKIATENDDVITKVIKIRDCDNEKEAKSRVPEEVVLAVENDGTKVKGFPFKVMKIDFEEKLYAWSFDDIACLATISNGRGDK